MRLLSVPKEVSRLLRLSDYTLAAISITHSTPDLETVTAGEELLGESAEKDASGNKKLPKVGEYLKKEVEDYFVKCGEVATGKSFDLQ